MWSCRRRPAPTSASFWPWWFPVSSGVSTTNPARLSSTAGRCFSVLCAIPGPGTSRCGPTAASRRECSGKPSPMPAAACGVWVGAERRSMQAGVGCTACASAPPSGSGSTAMFKTCRPFAPGCVGCMSPLTAGTAPSALPCMPALIGWVCSPTAISISSAAAVFAPSLISRACAPLTPVPITSIT